MSEIVAAIDIETTGLNPLYHDIIEIAILPLDGAFEPLGGASLPSWRESGQEGRKTRAQRRWKSTA